MRVDRAIYGPFGTREPPGRTEPALVLERPAEQDYKLRTSLYRSRDQLRGKSRLLKTIILVRFGPHSRIMRELPLCVTAVSRSIADSGVNNHTPSSEALLRSQIWELWICDSLCPCRHFSSSSAAPVGCTWSVRGLAWWWDVRASSRRRRTFILYTFALRYVAHLCRSPKQVFPSCNVPVHGGWVTGRLICLFCATSPSGDNDNKRRWESKTDDCERRP